MTVPRWGNGVFGQTPGSAARALLLFLCCAKFAAMNRLVLLIACIAQTLPVARADTLLVSHTNSWHYRKGTNAPPSGWQTAIDSALDSTWLTGNGGFGYADNT